MRCLIVFIVMGSLLLGELILIGATAQTQNNAQERAASLRAQLTEVEAKQSELQMRLKTLDEDLKPENIANSLAGVGSTHPEEEREQRRRQLEIERKGVQSQLNLLATNHTRLETAIAQADVEAYRQSAAPVTATATPVSTTTTAPGTAASAGATTTPERPRRVRKKRAKRSRRAAQQQTSP
jgi:hypothetical protein